MKIKSLLLAAALSVAAFTASATPQYMGNTFGTELTGTNNATGYYLWNDALSPSNWSLRWTDTSGSGVNPTWFGSIVFETSSLGSAVPFLFEASTDSLNVQLEDFDEDKFSWVAVTNTSGGIDGIDFTITSFIELMEINLGSSLFSAFPQELDDPGVAGQNIFIGGSTGTYGSTNVLVKKFSNGTTRQSFEIQVPAPGALALMGLGLVGLSLARRKK